MVDATRLCIHDGELGPVCDFCGERMTFGQSMTVDENYACPSCYEKQTEVTSATEGKEVTGLSMD